MNAIQSTGDAETLVVNSAIEAAKLKPTVVVGKDTDLMIILIHVAELSDNPLFFKSDEKSKLTAKVWDIKYTKEMLGKDVCNAILLIHALLGCDTASRMNTIGKQTALEKFLKNKTFQNKIPIFMTHLQDERKL